MKYFVFVFFGLVILGGVWVLRGERPAVDVAQKKVQEDVITQKAVIGDAEIQLEVVRTPAEQARGLSRRETLDANTGMLFIYETPAIPGFWMKEMNFPIDIIWIDESKKIVDITENLAPETFPQVFYPRTSVQYVLEVNANWARTYTVSIGDEVILYGVF